MRINIDKPCTQNWENMTQDAQGRFCNSCAKSVIDFTILSDDEVLEKLQASNEELCGRVKSSQLMTPIIRFKEPNYFKIPYSKVATNAMIIASTFAFQSCSSAPINHSEKINSSIVESENNQVKSIDKIGKVVINNDTQNFKGRLLSESDKKPIENGKIELITLTHIYTTYSDSLGNFILDIPKEAIRANNVVRTSYHKIVRRSPSTGEKLEFSFQIYKSADLVYSLASLDKMQFITAEQDQMILGGMMMHHDGESKITPIVLDNGIQVSYKEFQKNRRGEKSSCNLANQDYYYFSGESALALHSEAKDGLYLFIKPENTNL